MVILLVIHVDCKRESLRRQPAEVHAHKIASKDRKAPSSEEVIKDIMKERAENPKDSKEDSDKQTEDEAEREAEMEVIIFQGLVYDITSLSPIGCPGGMSYHDCDVMRGPTH